VIKVTDFKSKTLVNSIEKIKNNPDILDCNKNDILRFFEHSKSLVTEARILIYTYKLNIIGQYTTKPFKDVNREDVAKTLNQIQQHKYKESTFEQFKKNYKLFYRYLYELAPNEQLPESVRWLRTKFISNGLQAKDLLTDEEVELLIKATDDIQMKALIATLYETGVRISEATSIRFKDIQFNENGIFISVDGKTGKRVVGVVENYNIFQNWHENHPFKTKDSFFFSSTKEGRYGRPYTTQYLNRLWKSLAKKQNITKKVYNHLFRHSRATILYRDNPIMAKKILGHSMGSKMEKQYVHLADSSVEEYLLQVNGKIIDNKKTEKVCSRCNSSLSLTDKHCPKCGLLRDGINAIEWQENNLIINENNLPDIIKVLVPLLKAELAKP